MSASLIAKALLLLVAFEGVAAQRSDGQYWPCNPIVTTHCPPNLGLPNSTYTIDFTNLAAQPPDWTISNYATVNYGPQGAELTFAKRYDAPQLWTNFYMFFGRVDVLMKCAPGQGIISSAVLLSDDFDEIDWEWSGNNFGTAKSAGMVQNNYFPKGITGTYDRGMFINIPAPQTQWHTYSFDWNPTRLQWLIDGQVVRTFNAADADKSLTGPHQYPQTPSKLQLGLWDGGDAGESSGTVSWAGGYTDLSKAPFTMYVKSVKITNMYPAYAYNYTDMTGAWTSIQKIQDPNWNKQPGASSTSASSSPILKATGNTVAASSALAAATTLSGGSSSVAASSTVPPASSTAPTSAPPASSSASIASVQSSALSSMLSAAPSSQTTAPSTGGNQLCENTRQNSWWNIWNFIPILGGNYMGYSIQCNVDYPGADISQTTIPDFNACIWTCINYMGYYHCDAVAYLPDTKQCYLKTFQFGMPRTKTPNRKTYCALNRDSTSRQGRWRKRSPHMRRHARGSIHRR